MTKTAKKAWGALLVELAPILAAFMLPILLKKLTPAAPSCACGAGWRKAFSVVLAILAYGLFIGLTVGLIKLSWRLL